MKLQDVIQRFSNFEINQRTFCDNVHPPRTSTINNSNACACDLGMLKKISRPQNLKIWKKSNEFKIWKNVEIFEEKSWNLEISKKSQNLKIWKNVENFWKNLKISKSEKNLKISKSEKMSKIFEKKSQNLKIWKKLKIFKILKKSQNLKISKILKKNPDFFLKKKFERFFFCQDFFFFVPILKNIFGQDFK